MSAIGDLVATMRMDTRPFEQSAASTIQTLERVGGSTRTLEEPSRRTAGAYRRLGSDLERAGMLVGSVNNEFGSTVYVIGAVAEGVGVAARSYRALAISINTATASQVMLNLVSGPMGWVTLGIAVTAAGAAFLYYGGAVSVSTKALRAHVEELKKTVLEHDKEKSDLASVNKELERAYKERDRLASIYGTDITRRVAGQSLTPRGEAVRSQIELLLKRKEQLQADQDAEREKKYRDEQARITTEIDKQIESVKEHAATVNLDRAAIERRTIAIKGATDAQMAAYDAAAATARSAEAEKRRADLEEAGNKATGDALKKIRERTAALYMDAEALEHWQVAQSGMTNAQKRAQDEAISEYYRRKRGVDAQEERRKEAEGLRHEAESMKKSIETPAEKFRAAIEEIKRLKSVPGFDIETQRRAMAKARSDFLTSPQNGRANLAEFSTGAAWTGILDAIYGKGEADAAKETAENTKDAAKLLEEINGKLSTPGVGI